MRQAAIWIGSVAVALLFLWLLGLFWIPQAVWLAPFASGDSQPLTRSGRPTGSISLPGVVPGRREEQPGRLSLGVVRLEPGQAKLLRLRVGPNRALGLQIKRIADGAVVQHQRLRPSLDGTDYQIVLETEDRSERLRVTLWNRAASEVEVERAEVESLADPYRWARPGYWCLGFLIVAVTAWLLRADLGMYLRGGSAGLDTARASAADRLTAVALFFLCFLVFRIAPVHQLLDAKFISVVSHAVLTTGSVALPEDFARSRRVDRTYTLRRVGDEVYHNFSSAPGVLGVPIVALFERVGISPLGPDGEYLGHNEMRILRSQAALLAAATCALLFLIARQWLAPGAAIGITLVYAFGTQLLSTVSRPFWSHSWAIFLLSTALWLLVSPRLAARRWTYIAIATLMSWAYFCRPPISLAIIGIALYLWFERRSRLLSYLAGGSVWIVVMIVHSKITFGTLLPPYLWSSHVESGRLAGELLLSSYPEAVLGTLLSPGRGLFVYLPFLVVVIGLILRSWNWVPDRKLAWTAIGACIAHWQLVSLFRNWWGGQSFGPRLMSDLIPWFFLLNVFAAVAAQDAVRAGALRWRRRSTVAVLLTVALAVFVNVRGAWVQETQRGAGIWNWRYPQFLAGLLERPAGAKNPGSR